MFTQLISSDGKISAPPEFLISIWKFNMENTGHNMIISVAKNNSENGYIFGNFTFNCLQ